MLFQQNKFMCSVLGCYEQALVLALNNFIQKTMIYFSHFLVTLYEFSGFFCALQSDGIKFSWLYSKQDINGGNTFERAFFFHPSFFKNFYSYSIRSRMYFILPVSHQSNQKRGKHFRKSTPFNAFHAQLSVQWILKCFVLTTFKCLLSALTQF